MLETFVELWLLWGVCDFIITYLFTEGGRRDMGDVKVMLDAYGWHLRTLAGVVAIFMFAILLGPVTTYKNWKIRRLVKQALEKENK